MKISSLQTLFLVVSLTLTFTLPALALDSTPSASPDDTTVTENLKQRLIETINQVDSNAAPSVVGYVGRVRDIVQNTIVLEDKSGKRNVLVSDNSDILRSPGNTTIKLENVRIDDGIIAIGSLTDSRDELQGKRIIVSENPFVPVAKTSGIATISKVSKTSLSLSPLGGSSPLTLTLNSKTIVKSPDSSLEVSDLSVGDAVIYSALVDSNNSNNLTATIIMRTAAAPAASPTQ